MKANEFVKQHGVKQAKFICDRYFDYTHVTDDARMLISEKDYVEFAPHFKSSLSDAVKISDLKRLVESHELVKKMGGLNGAINSLSLLECSLAIDLYHGVVGVNAEAQISELKQAIADVESCMEVTK